MSGQHLNVLSALCSSGGILGHVQQLMLVFRRFPSKRNPIHTHTHMRAHRYGWIDPHTRQAQHTADSCRPGPKPQATGTRATPTPCCHATDIVMYTRASLIHMRPHICTCTLTYVHVPTHMYMYPHAYSDTDSTLQHLLCLFTSFTNSQKQVLSCPII